MQIKRVKYIFRNIYHSNETKVISKQELQKLFVDN